jgi:hypothetical protein
MIECVSHGYYPNRINIQKQERCKLRMNDSLKRYGVSVRSDDGLEGIGKWIVTLRYEALSGYLSIDPGIVIYVNGKEALRISMNDETGVKEEKHDITEFFIPSEVNDVKIETTVINFRFNDDNYNLSESSAKLRFTRRYVFNESFKTNEIAEKISREFPVKDPRR